MVAGEVGWGWLAHSEPSSGGSGPGGEGARRAESRLASLDLPDQPERIVAATVHLSEFLLAAAGLVQRLAAQGVRIDILVAAEADEEADRADALALAQLRVGRVARHRLALPVPVGADRVDDLVAGLSELVGFAPEAGVCCLAPSADVDDPSRAAVGAAAERIARVYRLPLVRFAAAPGGPAVELGLAADEWERKSIALAACAPRLAPLSGEREFFAWPPRLVEAEQADPDEDEDWDED